MWIETYEESDQTTTEFKIKYYWIVRKHVSITKQRWQYDAGQRYRENCDSSYNEICDKACFTTNLTVIGLIAVRTGLGYFKSITVVRQTTLKHFY